jgi:hypothetical protein
VTSPPWADQTGAEQLLAYSYSEGVELEQRGLEEPAVSQVGHLARLLASV